MAPFEVSDRAERVFENAGFTLAISVFLSWLVLVAPDPGPLVALPTVAGLSPLVWFTVVLYAVCYPVVAWLRR